MTNYTAGYMSFLGVKIKDNLGHSIDTLNLAGNHLRWKGKFSKPFVTYNLLCEEEIKTPEITNLHDIKDVWELGFVLCSVPIPKDMRWNKWQRNILQLFQKNSEESRLYTNLQAIPRKSSGTHKVEYDEANLRLRVCGPKAGPTGYGVWIKL